MDILKTYECRIDEYFNDGTSLKSNHIGKTPAQARYKFYLKHSECLNEYSECFKYIKSKTIGKVEPNDFFGDYDKFIDICKRRNIEFAYQGMKIDVSGKKGWIVGGNSHNNLDVLFEENYYISNCHPTWETTFYDNNNNIIKDFKEKK